ncbi:hypothetical protein N136_04736, partial [Leifsonia aquatica ATCC 14665]
MVRAYARLPCPCLSAPASGAHATPHQHRCAETEQPEGEQQQRGRVEAGV